MIAARRVRSKTFYAAYRVVKLYAGLTGLNRKDRKEPIDKTGTGTAKYSAAKRRRGRKKANARNPVLRFVINFSI
jgi:hypothetical protein